MRFCPNEPPDHYKGQRLAWNYLKRSFEGDEGIAYYRYPVFSGSGSRRREPDFLVVSRKFGIWVFECKGARLDNIQEINGQEWVMQRWYSERMTPVQQAEDQMFEVKALVERERSLRSLGIVFDYRILLPFVKPQEWIAAGFADHPSAKGVVLVGEQMDRKALRAELRQHGLPHMPALTDEQWETLKGVFRGEVSDREPQAVPSETTAESPLRVIHAVEARLRQLDEAQERVAQEAPEGPQRIRGLAGTGKTVLFAKRAARMHAAHPDWQIGFVFFTRSLYQQVRGLVERAYGDLTAEAPDPGQLHIWHAWGGKDITGFYREAALRWEQRPLNLNDAKKAIGSAAWGADGFAWVCDQLEAAIAGTEEEPFLDALLVDEGQDLPASFYRLAHRALRPPHRLYWAYDEAQGIGNLMVPRAVEIFGRDRVGEPVVDLAGSYSSGIRKAHNLNRCYRTPARILSVAHAFNMGLRRRGGPLQGVTTRDEWELLGYRVEGDFSQASVAAGGEIVIERDQAACGHPMDDRAFATGASREGQLEILGVEDSEAAVAAIVEGIRADIDGGLEPHDLLVVPMPGSRPGQQVLADALVAAGVPAFVAGTDKERSSFRRTGYVTVANIFRAKGNEAWKVYATGLDAVDPARCPDADDELVRRNQVFVALSRARLWCVAIGVEGPVLEELRLLRAEPRIRFPAFNQRSLRRSIDHEESPQEQLFQ
jgi:superfamily I DNA and RNA helicase